MLAAGRSWVGCVSGRLDKQTKISDVSQVLRIRRVFEFAVDPVKIGVIQIGRHKKTSTD